MSRALRPIACVMAVAALGAAALTVVVNALARAHGVQHTDSAFAELALVLGVGAPACVGLFLVLRRPATRVAWILLAGALSVAVVMAVFAVSELTLHDDRGSSLGAWTLLVAQAWLVLFACPLALTYVYPDGRLPSRRWRPAAGLALVSCGGAMLLLLCQRTLDGPYGPVPNPLGLDVEGPVLTPVFWACWGGVLLSLFGAVLSLRARYRAGGPEQRRQILWLAYGALLLPLWLGGASLWSLFFPRAWPRRSRTSPAVPRCRSRSRPRAIARPREVEAVAYFIACEALTNAVKHASPSRVIVKSTRTDGLLRLVVADDGIGGAAPTAGTGLAGMVDRVAAQGGTLAVDSPAGAGTRIAVELPCAS